MNVRLYSLTETWLYGDLGWIGFWSESFWIVPVTCQVTDAGVKC